MEALRIRTVKPEFWRSDDVAALSIADRLLFIGLWSYVDDSGIGVDKLPHICADLFAPDLASDPAGVFERVAGGLQTLAERGMIQRYTVEGKPYLYVTNWTSHQRIDKPSKRRYPLPDQAEHPSSVSPREDYGSTPANYAPGTGEQGNRGTEQVGSRRRRFRRGERPPTQSRNHRTPRCRTAARPTGRTDRSERQPKTEQEQEEP